MRQSGLDRYLIANQHNDDFVYGGYSAGICVLAPSLHGIDLIDNPHIAPTGYRSPPIWEGLSILDFCIAPHYKSDHPESHLVDKAIEYFLDNKILFKALRDGDVLVMA